VSNAFTVVQKIALTAIVDQAHNSNKKDPRPSRRLGGANFVGPLSRLIRPENEHDLAVDKLAMRNRRTLPSRQRTYCHKRIAQARFEAREEVKAFSQR
jgi:hypothetical protein